MGTGIRVFVPGAPQTKGSAKAFMRPGAKFPTVMNDNPRNKSWEGQVKHALLESGHEFRREQPVYLTLQFWFTRPKSHYRGGKNATLLANSAPFWHVSKPDLDKVIRSVKDACKGIVYADDSQVYAVNAIKRYADRFDGQEGVEIQVEYVTNELPAPVIVAEASR